MRTSTVSLFTENVGLLNFEIVSAELNIYITDKI